MGIFAKLMAVLRPQPVPFPTRNTLTGGTEPHVAGAPMSQQLGVVNPGTVLQPMTMEYPPVLPAGDRAFLISGRSKQNKQIGVLPMKYNRYGWGLKGYLYRQQYGFDRTPGMIYQPTMTINDRLPNPVYGDRNQGWVNGND